MNGQNILLHFYVILPFLSSWYAVLFCRPSLYTFYHGRGHVGGVPKKTITVQFPIHFLNRLIYSAVIDINGTEPYPRKSAPLDFLVINPFFFVFVFFLIKQPMIMFVATDIVF